MSTDSMEAIDYSEFLCLRYISDRFYFCFRAEGKEIVGFRLDPRSLEQFGYVLSDI